jgi:Zn-dependent protease with chaperone function
LNAYAARLARRLQVVLESGLVEALENDPEALEFVIAHELGHHLAKHTTLVRHLFIAPIGIFGLVVFQLGLSRGQEFTADRYGLHGSRNLQAAERALMVLLGGRLAAAADANAVEAQWRNVGVVGRLAELAATHPNCPRRLGQLREYARTMRLAQNVEMAA